ncbi:MAG: hypothetical protein KDA72_11170 [Planctomycetales bacterium]|nr:hypothetical protein [Planctomycetales bacterium]
MNTWLKTICFLTLSVCLLPKAQADLILQFSPDNLQSGTTVSIGNTFAVDLYVAESGGETGMVDSGLFSFGTLATYSTANLQFLSGTIDPVWTPLFSELFAGPQQGQISAYGAAFDEIPKADVIHLATFQFQAIEAGITSILFGDLDSTIDDFTLGDATVDNPFPTSLDVPLFGDTLTNTYGFSVNIQSTAVPESSAFSSIIFAFILWLLRKRVSGRLPGIRLRCRSFNV